MKTLEEKPLTTQELFDSTRLSRGKIFYHLKLLEKNRVLLRKPATKRGTMWEHTGLGQQLIKD